MSTLARRAWRRPVTDKEVVTLTSLVAKSRAEGSNTDQALQEAIEAILASPNFLFHIEHDAGPEPIPYRASNSPRASASLSGVRFPTTNC